MLYTRIVDTTDEHLLEKSAKYVRTITTTHWALKVGRTIPKRIFWQLIFSSKLSSLFTRSPHLT